MREVKITDLLNRSIERTGDVLFKPFSPKKWCKLLLIACLAGGIPGGGFGGGHSSGSHSEKKAEAAPVIVRDQASGATATAPTSSAASTPTCRLPSRDDRVKKYLDGCLSRLMLLPAAVLSAVIFTAVVLALSLMLLFMWLGARFKFVWFEAVAHNRDAIAEPFGRYRTEGNSIFGLWLAVSAGSLVFIGVLIAWVGATLWSVGFFKNGPTGAGGAIASLVLAGVVFIVGMIGLALWDMAVEHFVITIMALERITFRPAWQKFWQIYTTNTKDFWMYVLALFLAGIVSSFAEGVVFFVVLIGFLIAAALIVGLAYLLVGIIMHAKAMFWTVVIILAIPSGILFVVAMMCVGLPFAVFFRTFSLYFLSSLNCGYVPLALPDPRKIG
jgi:hypothetical protein